jgi:hypothetical protein
VSRTLINGITKDPVKQPTSPNNISTNSANIRYDWEAIKLEYITGYVTTDPSTGIKLHTYPTHKDLHLKYGCNEQYVSQRSCKDKWGEQRKFFKAKLNQKFTQDQITAYISESAQFDAQTVDKLKKLYKLVDAYLNQYSNVIDDDDNSFSFDNLPEGVTRPTIKELLELSNLLDKCSALIRRTLGEPITNDVQFKELMSDINKGIGPTNLQDTEDKIQALSKKRETYAASMQSMREEITRLKKESGL